MQRILAAISGARSMAEVVERASRAVDVAFTKDSIRKRLAAHRECCNAPTAGQLYGSPYSSAVKYGGARVVDLDDDDRDTLPGMRAPTPAPPPAEVFEWREPIDPPIAIPQLTPERCWIDEDPEAGFLPVIEPENDWPSRRVLKVPDSHWPYVSHRAWSLMMRAAEQVVKPDTIVVLGDLGDFYSVSQHDKSPGRASKLQAELDSMKLALDHLDSLGARRKVYCSGNHERRQARLIAKVAPQLDGLVQSWEEYLGLKRRGWELIPYWRIGRVGNILVTHDVGIGGDYASKRTLALVAAMGATDIAFGHTHQLSKSWLGSLRGRPSTAVTCGWLGSHQSADYVPSMTAFSKYHHGFGVAVADDTGHLTTELGTIAGERATVLGQSVRL
jgi:predicted phosphodiesterase